MTANIGLVGGLAILMVAMLGVVPASAASAAAPTVVATPDRNLVDGQTVTVRGSGYKPNTTIFILQCDPGGQVTPDDCEINTLTTETADSTGSFSTTLFVFRFIQTSAGRIDCAAFVGACAIGADDLNGTTDSAPLGFDPNAPTRPPLEVTVSFESAAIKSNQVLLKGVVHCNRPSDVYVDGRVRQVVRRVFIDGTFTTQVHCENDQPFAVVFEGKTGVLKKGAAELLLNATGFAGGGDSDTFTSTTTVQLSPK